MAALEIWDLIFHFSNNGSLDVHYIDVGQADSSLVMCDGESMLIDGGNAGTVI